MRGKQELFNYRYSSVRNVIERCIGVLKARFKILKHIPNNYQWCRQVLIPKACAALHNFIRNEDRLDRLFTEFGEDGLSEAEHEGERGENDQEFVSLDMTTTEEMNATREEIADKLWEDYKVNRGHR